jgi:serine/threonine protein kinase
MSDESGMIDDACSQFEAAWQTGQQPRIEDFLPAESPEISRATLRDLLVHLVGIDLEWRWKIAGVDARQPAFPDVSQSTVLLPLRPRLADYVARYSLLGPVEQLPCELIVDEYYVRRRYGGRPTHSEYLDVFGSRHPDLANHLQAIDGGMVSDCPDPSSESLPETRLWQPEVPESRQAGDDTAPRQPQPPRKGSVGHPDRIGRYRIERVLGKGAFGTVYRGYDDTLKRLVAIKVPHRRLVDKPEDMDLYLEEAQVVASLDHANIVPVHDVGRTDDGLCYVVCKFIEGSDLARRIRENRLSHCESAGLIAAIAEALHHAHLHMVVHRDVKPANILIETTGKAYLADFGLALKEEDFGGGSSGAGTPAYMSPEQARREGHLVDGRADIFSLGVVFYELLTANRPFWGANREEVIERIRSLEVRPPRQLDDSIPKELERICLKALSKRASDRYTTALDMAEDLRHFLAQTAEAKPVDAGKVEMLLNPVVVTPATPSPAGLDSGKPVKIVPKGLRSFDAQDADFFLELLPGPRDRDGLPESIRFWKYRIEETNADKTFRVGLIYGPSGCGKSSLVKAGLLPRLAGHLISIYVEATADDTEARLLRGLRKQCPGLQENLGLKDSIAALRRGRGIPAGRKVFIVLDQFEQWLHAKKNETNTELIEALRHCDGERVQCIVMVRDDFWLAATRFMQELEIHLLQGQNSALVDLFDLDHARKVLAAFGRAFGKLPEKSATKEQKQFLAQAVAGASEDGKVVCVRLALFAEMMKGKPWTPATLKEVGGTEGVGVTFLEETFSASTAPPDHRYHQKAARAVLKALLPESGTDIKGHMRSYAELLAASSYADRPQDFHDLIGILDGEIRLITPTDPRREGRNRLVLGASRCEILPTHARLPCALATGMADSQAT